MPLLAFPNVSEGRDAAVIASVAEALTADAELLDSHSDPTHNRTAFTIAGEAGPLPGALLAGAHAALAIDMNAHEGGHPCIGALDVCPVIWLADADRDQAVQAAGVVAEGIAALGVPVFLYGELASSEERHERAFFRRGGVAELRRRMAAGELKPDHGPPEAHPTAGATLVTARPPLAAFNVELDSGEVELARQVAAELRESGGGLPGVRAIGLDLEGDSSQVCTNVHDPVGTPLGRVVEQVRELAAAEDANPVAAEIVGLVPEASLEGYPEDVPIKGFDRARQTIEGRLGELGLG